MHKLFLIRLDDASEYMHYENWIRMEKLLYKYSISPLVGIIPNNQDTELLKYGLCTSYEKTLNQWKEKGWSFALHGYNHVFTTNEGGINPINYKSEFAGVSLELQKKKIRDGYGIIQSLGIEPLCFFAPAHTFDLNTLQALKEETDIRIISDTIANDIYYEDDFYFIPQQSGVVRNLPFNITTFCYHPNLMTDVMFNELEDFIKKHKLKFSSFDKIELKKRKRNLVDLSLNKLYFFFKRIKASFYGY